MPPYKQTETDWIAKERRELFCKAVNSIMMTNSTIALKQALDHAQTIVDRAFKLYPDKGKGSKGEDFEFPS